MEKMTTSQAQDVFQAVEEATRYVTADRMDPEAAVAKAASARGYRADMARRTAEAFNTHSALSHMKTAELADRIGDYPVANPELVVEHMFPGSLAAMEKSAESLEDDWVPSEGLHEETRDFASEVTKQAALAGTDLANLDYDTPQYDVDMVYRRALTRKRDLERELDQAKYAAHGASDRAQAAVAEFIEYFLHTPGALSFKEAERRVVGYWGEQGQELMELVYPMVKGRRFRTERWTEKSAACLVDTSKEPFSLVAKIFKAREGLQFAAKSAMAVRSRLERFSQELDARTHGGTVKSAVGFKSLLDPSKGIDSAAQEAKQRAEKAKGQSALTPTTAEDSLRAAEQSALQARLMLYYLRKTDPVIASQPREDVARTFAEFSEAFPNLADQPIKARAQVREAVEQGGMTAQGIESATKAESQSRPDIKEVIDNG